MRGEREYLWPTESAIGKNCLFWSQELGCIFQKKQWKGEEAVKVLLTMSAYFLKMEDVRKV